MKTIEEIYQAMLDSFQSWTGFRPLDGTDSAARLYAAAVQIHPLYRQAELIRDNCYPQNAQGQWLDYQAQLCGLTRGEGETDEELRVRVLDNDCRGDICGTTAWYEHTALQVPGVTAACTVPRARGIGTVDVYIAGENGLPDSALVTAVTKKLQAQREISVNVQVKAPAPKTVSVKVNVQLQEGAAPGVLEDVRTAVTDFFSNGRLLGRPVLLAELGNRIFQVPGVENYRIVTPAADIAGDSKVLPILGTLIVAVAVL